MQEEKLSNSFEITHVLLRICNATHPSVSLINKLNKKKLNEAKHQTVQSKKLISNYDSANICIYIDKTVQSRLI